MRPASVSNIDHPSSTSRSAAATVADLPPMIKSLLSGCFSGTCSAVLFQPLEVLKTRVQNRLVQLEKLKFHDRPGNRGILLRETKVIARQYGFAGFWRGLTPALLRTVPGVGLYFGFIHTFQVLLTHGMRELHPHESPIVGFTSRAVTGIILLPFTILKTRFESGVYNYIGVGAALKDIFVHEGKRGLFSGLVPTLIRDAPYSAIFLLFYTEVKKLVPSDYWQIAPAPIFFSCGVVAAVMSASVTQPADVIRTQMQLYPGKFPQIKTAIKHIHKLEGWEGFFRGWAPRCMRKCLMTAMSWTVYEQVMRSLGLRSLPSKH